MNDLIRPALYGARHRVSTVSESIPADAFLTPQDTLRYAIVGPVCESGDKLAEDVLLPELHRGDLLIIHHAGAYGMSMASNYNARPRGAEVLVDDGYALTPNPSPAGKGGHWKVIRPREALESLWASEVECLG
jgi:diaminopimelate decarboxylase